MIGEDFERQYQRANQVGDLLGAHEISARAAIHFEAQGDAVLAALWQARVGVMLYYQGRYDEAIRVEAMAAEMQPDPYQRANTNTQLAYKLSLRGDYPSAFMALGKAEEIARSLEPDARLESDLWHTKGFTFYCMNDLDRAITHYQRAIDVWPNGDFRKAVAYHNNLGFCLARTRSFADAEQHLLRAMELEKNLPRPFQQATILDSLGTVYTSTDRYDAAERVLNNALEIAMRIGNKPMSSEVLLHLSELRERTHQYRDSVDTAKLALRFAAAAGFEPLVIDARARVTRLTPRLASRRRPRTFHGLIYLSKEMDKIVSAIRVVAKTKEIVLISGETGTGKELIAQAIHRESDRKNGPFITFNCSVVTRDLVESRLFGHRRGSFSHALRDEIGIVRAADGGTLFLDEIGDLPLESQGALLRFLQNDEVQPIGENAPRAVDVRVVAATNRELRKEVIAGRFRKDLFYRLSVASIQSPPLRDRPEDIVVLARYFNVLHAKRYGLPEHEFTTEELEEMSGSYWPGNIRELENYVKQRILFGHKPPDGGVDQEDRTRNWNALTWLEKRRLAVDTMRELAGNITRVAEKLAVSRRTVQRLLRSLDE